MKREFYDRLSTTPDSEKEPLLAEHKKVGSTTGRCGDTDNAAAWMVALGIFALNFVIQGMGRLASIFYVDFMQVFEVSRKTASVPYSLQQSTRMLLGPVVGILGQQLGITTVTVLGVLVAAISCAACYFTEGMAWIIILWGGFYGFGTALAGTVNIILIDQYFVRHRSSATGFAFSGTSLGAIFFPALMDIVLQKYELRGTFLLMGSIILLALPIAMLLSEKTKPEGNSLTQKSFGTSSKYSSLLEIGDSREIDSKPSSTDVQRKLASVPTDSSLSDTVSSEKLSEKGDVKESVPSTSQAKDLGGRTSKEVLEGSEITLPGLRGDSSSNLGEITARPQMCEDKHRGKISHKTSEKSKKDTDKMISVKFTESKNSESSTVETSVELSSKANSSGASDPSNVIAATKDSSDDCRQKDLPISLAAEIQEKCGSVLSSSKRKYERRIIHPKRIKKSASAKKSKKQARVRKARALKVFKDDDGESPVEEKMKVSTCYENVIDFEILHENIDLVIDLLTNKIPLADEDVLSSSSEITQSNLESSDTEFISKELRRLEEIFQLPDVEVQIFLSEIQKKQKKFTDLLNADRNQFLNQKNADFAGKELVYKDIRNTTIRKPDCTIEITEYSFEIPIDLFIPVKLQELNERSSKYVTSHYSGDKRVLKILKQLKRLHEIFSTPVSPVSYSFKSDTVQPTFSSKSSSGLHQTAKYENTFRRNLITALGIHINPMFLLLCLCRALTVLTFVPVVTSVVDFSIDKGMEESDGTYAIIALSAGDLLGRLCTGWITDKGFISEKNYMVVSLLLLGISTATLPRMTGIAMLLPALGIFAIFQGTLFVKHSILLMKYLRKNEKYIGLGFMNFLAGVLGLVIPYYIGYFRDYLGSYDTLYYINGGLSGFVGFLWVLEPFFSRFVPVIREGDYTATSL